MGETLIEKVFSIKNDKDGRHKVVRVLGCKLKLKKIDIKQKLDYFKIMHDRSLYVGIPDNLSLQLSFNNDCNCRCKFCGEDISQNPSQLRLIPDKWLYDDLLPLYSKTSNLIPTYGELTHRPEGYKYISFIHEHFPHINIFLETNGIAFSEKWAQLATDNLMRVNFSINAINEEYFKKTVWDKDGVYPVVQKNFDRYLQILKDKNMFAFKPSVSCVLNSSNYETIEDFIKIYVQKGIQNIIIFFDFIENPVWTGKKNNNCIVEETIIKLIEMERVLKGKVLLGWRLFIPTDNIDAYDDIVNKMDINDLNKKYAELLISAKDLDLKKLYEEKTKLRQIHGKAKTTYFEEITGVTYHQNIMKGRSVCSNPWSHLRLRPNGDFEVCSWRGYRSSENVRYFIKNNKIDWEKLFNSFFYRNLRKNFAQSCYPGCMPNCPGKDCISKAEFEEKYNV